MTRSLRLRLALLSALLTGVVLLLFGAGSWWLVRESKMQSMDSELRAFAGREVSHSRDAAGWHQQEALLAASLGLRDARDVVLLVQQEGETRYRSVRWPQAWDTPGLAWPVQPAAPHQTGSGFALLPQAQAAEALAAEPAWQPRSDAVLLAQAGAPGAVDGPRPGPPGPGLRPPHRLGERPRLRPDGTAPPWAPGPPGGPRPPAAAAPLHDPADPTALAPAVPAAAPAPPVAGLPLALPQTAAGTPLQPAAPPESDQPPLRLPPAVQSLARTSDGEAWRMALASAYGAQLAVAVSVRAIEADMRGIRNGFLLALPLALLLTGAASWLFARRALTPLDKLVRATRQVTAGGLDQRIGVAGEDREFVELIEVFNRMLGRLERSFQQAHRFSADAAHELKTPLAIVQGQLERAIQQADDGSPLQGSLSSILDEVRRLSVISRKLLLLSQADAGHLAVLRAPVDLSRMLEELLEDTRMLAPQLLITAEIQPDLLIQADASLLRQVLHNLVSNAIKYNLEGGWIRIGTARWAQRVEVLVANASGGIAPAHRARLFERFFRGDAAHSRQVEGVGLGLSVSREIARAHGGDLSLRSESAASVEFSLLLPL